MEITRSNYELYVVDYLEGRLPADQVAALLLFLEEHPDLREELDMLREADTQLPEDDTVFNAKSSLYRPQFSQISADWDEKLAAKLEGDWTEKDERDFQQAMKAYPELEKEWALMQQTRLLPEMQVAYPNKRELKHKTVAFPMYGNIIRWSAAAALLAGVCFWWWQQSVPADQPLANNQPEIHRPADNSVAQNQRVNPLKDNRSDKQIIIEDITPSSRQIASAQVKAQNGPQAAFRREEQAVAYAPLKKQFTVNPIRPQEIPLSSTPVAYNSTARPYTDYDLQVDEFNTLEEIIEHRLASSAKQVLVEVNAPVPLPGKKERFRVKDIGLLAVRAYNKVTGSDVVVERRYDNDGRIVGVGLVSASSSFEVYRSQR